MVRLPFSGLGIVMGCLCRVAPAVAGEWPADSSGGGCSAGSFHYAQSCAQPSKPQGTPPQLLSEDGRREPCREVADDESILAKLEVLVDSQGRVVRVRVVDAPGPCAKACLEPAARLTFSPASVAGIPTAETTTLACRPAPEGTRGDSQAVSATQSLALETQTIVEFLLTAAATDFRTHRPPEPARFRNVRIGHVLTSRGTQRYMLCGQFLPAHGAGSAVWMAFATIKTSGYEQWIGAQADGFCQNSTVIWEKVGDLSSSLESRLASLR